MLQASCSCLSCLFCLAAGRLCRRTFHIFKDILEPYTRLIFGDYFNTALLIAFGLIFAVFLYFIPRRFKLKAVLTASIIFLLISSSIGHFLVFFLFVAVLYACSNYSFKLRAMIFWITEAFMLASGMIFYRLFNYYSPFYSFASYYTMFRSIHYFVDVKQESLQKTGFIEYIGYLFYFPSFSHGPVDRIGVMQPQDVTKGHLIFGLKRIFYGIAKYLLLVYALSQIEKVPFSFWDIWRWLFYTAYGNAIQLYVLLSGDIDIVIGISSLMGFGVSENYPRVPYLQPNLTKFWQNWQSTIVSWLTAYVYFPLCRNKKHVYLKTMLIIMIIGWLHLFYLPEILQFKGLNQLIEFILYYTLWGVFLGGALALSKLLEKKKSGSKQGMEQKHPFIAKILYADTIFTKALTTFITFNIIAIGWLSPLYILLRQFT